MNEREGDGGERTSDTEGMKTEGWRKKHRWSRLSAVIQKRRQEDSDTDRVRKAETQKARKTDLVGKIKHRKDPCIETQRNRETRQKQTKMEKEMGNK